MEVGSDTATTCAPSTSPVLMTKASNHLIPGVR
jgi:hypothetical protein